MNVAGIDFNTDVNNVVLQRNTDDGGDAPARTGDLFFWIGVNSPKGSVKYAVEDLQSALDKLAVPGSPGDYYRYPPQPQYKIASDFSRDQRMQMLLAQGSLGFLSDILASAKADLKRFSRTPNGDVIGPQEWAMYVRALYATGWWPVAVLWPLVFFGDLFQIANVLLISLVLAREPSRIAKWLASKGLYFLAQQYPSSVAPNNPSAWSQYGPKNVGNDILAVLYMLASKRWLPTPASWLARKLYKWLRPTYDMPYVIFDSASHSYVNAGSCDKTNGATYAFSVYFMPSTNANPFDLLYKNTLIQEIK